MKIAVVIDNLSYGGAQTVCVDYVNILCKLGHSVDVFNLAPQRNEVECRLPDDVHVFHYNFPLDAAPTRYYIGIKAYWFGKYVFPLVYVFKTLTMYLRKFFFKWKDREYDVAIAFAGHYNDLCFVAHNFVKTRKKLCWTHGALFQNFMCSDGFLDSYLKIKNIVVLNKTAQEEALATNHFLNLEDKLNIKLLYNPVRMDDKEIDQEKVLDLRQKYGDFAIMVARFSYPHKDQYTVVRAFKELKDKYSLDKKILFLGDGPERDKVEDYAASIGMGNNCVFVGAHNDVQNYYAAATMLVHSSVAFEGFALILVEAMSYNIPVVSTDTMVGPREVLGSDEYGLLCKVKDFEDMASKIAVLYTNSDIYRHYVEMGVKRRKDFSYETVGERLNKILGELK